VGGVLISNPKNKGVKIANGKQVKKTLTCMSSSHTIVHVDQTATKILDRINELERMRWDIERELSSLRKALEVAEVRPQGVPAIDLNEHDYVLSEPFKGKTLVEACETILNDHRGYWFNKSQVEYLIRRGGYQFETPNPTNSVEVTLRRLADNGKCSVERARGKRGNKYSIPQAEKQRA
jgi:hypothetical protein